MRALFFFASYVIFSGKWPPPPPVRLNGHRPPLAATTYSTSTASVAAAGGIQYLREVGVPPVTLSLTTYTIDINTHYMCRRHRRRCRHRFIRTNAKVEINRFLSIF